MFLRNLAIHLQVAWHRSPETNIDMLMRPTVRFHEQIHVNQNDINTTTLNAELQYKWMEIRSVVPHVAV